jgi:hypothetical protein
MLPPPPFPIKRGKGKDRITQPSVHGLAAK